MEITIAVILGLIRIFGVRAAWFQALSHLYVGALFGMWWINRNSPFADISQKARNSLVLAGCLSLLELSCFLIFKFLLIE